MFLSKLFSIFKRKKNDQPSNVPSATPPTTGTVGAAVGLSQPNQSVTPGPTQVAEAGPAEPDFPAPDVEAAADIPAPPVTPAIDTPPTDNATTKPQIPAEEPSVAPVPENPVSPPAEAPSEEPQPSDDSQNITV